MTDTVVGTGKAAAQDRTIPEGRAESRALEPMRVPGWAWLVLVGALFVVHVVAFDNGVLLGRFAEPVHEFFHDARHFASFGCH